MFETEYWPELPEELSLKEFYARTIHWQEIIQQHIDSPDLSDYTAQARAELNAGYPYFMAMVHASGRGVFHMVDEDGDIIGDGTGNSDGFVGIAKGIDVLEIKHGEGQKDVRIMHKILIGQGENAAFSTLRQNYELYSFLDISGNIILVSEMNKIFGEDEFEERDMQELYQRIGSDSQKLAELFRSTGFRRIKRARQQQDIVEEFISKSNHENRIVGMKVIAEADYAHVPFLKDGRQLSAPVDISKVVISGRCLGLHAIDSLALVRKAIRRDSDLIDKGSGLSIVLSPDEETRTGLRLDEDRVLFVPISSQEIGVHLSPDFE